MERLCHGEMRRDDVVQQREHDEVEHDRHDHFARTEARAQHAGHRAHHATAYASRDHAHHDRDDGRSSGGKNEPGDCREETLAGLS